jgi:uncharacterized membrane protein
MDPISLVQSLAALTVTAFFLWLLYGALLIVADSDREWKKRYGNRWIMSKSEKARLDKAYAESQQNKKAS